MGKGKHKEKDKMSKCFCLNLQIPMTKVASLPFIGVLSWVVVESFRHPREYPMFPLSLLILVSTDTLSDIVLIVAAHMKQVKLFQYYYCYSLVILVIFIIIMVLSIVNEIVTQNYAPYVVYLFLSEITVPGLGFIMLQVYIYITLLVRTEIIKLRDNCKFEFVNHANESQCTVNIEINQPIVLTQDA